ncbi:hypothetical protein F4782DRAFT_264298 [Xylaria castorea]|nr:hypothetical protein F4782DRAFT_264298 [Xylaria castorea]
MPIVMAQTALQPTARLALPLLVPWFTATLGPTLMRARGHKLTRRVTRQQAIAGWIWKWGTFLSLSFLVGNWVLKEVCCSQTCVPCFALVLPGVLFSTTEFTGAARHYLFTPICLPFHRDQEEQASVFILPTTHTPLFVVRKS